MSAILLFSRGINRYRILNFLDMFVVMTYKTYKTPSFVIFFLIFLVSSVSEELRGVSLVF
jgi:hypothetical protein